MQAENQHLRRELDQLSREVVGLRVALRSIINALGPDRVCRCNVHDCGLAEEASDALETARAALARFAESA